MQFFVQPRRTGDGQCREKGDDNADANAGARLHASRRFSRCETLRKFFEPFGSVQENSILFLFLLLSLFRWEIAEGITNRNGGSGESRLLACSLRQPAANRFRAHIEARERGHSAQRPNAAGWRPALPRSASSVAAME